MAPSKNIFGAERQFHLTCGDKICDTRFQFCDKSLQTTSCVSCPTYEGLAVHNEQLKPLFNTNCQEYKRYKASQISSGSHYAGIFSPQGNNPPSLGNYNPHTNQMSLAGRQHPATDATTGWLESEKELLFFLTKLHLCITGVLLAMVVFLVGSKMKRMRRSRQSCRVKLGDPLLWDAKMVPRKPSNNDESGNGNGGSKGKKLIDSPPLPRGKDIDKPVSNFGSGSLFLSSHYRPPPLVGKGNPGKQRLPSPPPLPPVAQATNRLVGGVSRNLATPAISTASSSHPQHFPLLSRPSAVSSSIGGRHFSGRGPPPSQQSISEVGAMSTEDELPTTSDSCTTSRSDFHLLRLNTPLHHNSPNISIALSSSVLGGGSSQFRFDDVPVTYAQEDSDARSNSRRHN